MVIDRPDDPRAWIADYIGREQASQSGTGDGASSKTVGQIGGYDGVYTNNGSKDEAREGDRGGAAQSKPAVATASRGHNRPLPGATKYVATNIEAKVRIEGSFHFFIIQVSCRLDRIQVVNRSVYPIGSERTACRRGC